MGFARSTEFAETWEHIRPLIPEGSRKEAASYLYDLSGELDVDDWDGSTLLEKDARINQDLDT